MEPALRAGLSLSATTGSITGTPTVSAAPGPYVVTATNGAGESTASLIIAVSAAPLIDLGHAASVQFLRLVNSSVLSQDGTGHWVLWNFTTAQELASGSSPTFYNPWSLASDGSYICAGSTSGLMVWSITGAVLAAQSGDYSKAIVFAVPGQVQVGLGPSGANVIQTVAVPGGTSTISASFQGQFQSWFNDGARNASSLAGHNLAQFKRLNPLLQIGPLSKPETSRPSSHCLISANTGSNFSKNPLTISGVCSVHT